MREAQARCDSAEYALWVADYWMEPWGEEREDIRIGKLGCDMATVMRGQKASKGSKAITFKVDDFVLRYASDETRSSETHQSPEEMQAVLRTMQQQLGGK